MPSPPLPMKAASVALAITSVVDVRTPVLDRFAEDAVLFSRHYSQATPCGPSRAALLTGTYSFNNRSIANGTPLDARHLTIAREKNNFLSSALAR